MALIKIAQLHNSCTACYISFRDRMDRDRSDRVDKLGHPEKIAVQI